MIRAEYIIDRADLIGFCVVLSFVVMFAASFLSKYFFGFDMFERHTLYTHPRTSSEDILHTCHSFATARIGHWWPNSWLYS